jgi:hypothetical protein
MIDFAAELNINSAPPGQEKIQALLSEYKEDLLAVIAFSEVMMSSQASKAMSYFIKASQTDLRNPIKIVLPSFLLSPAKAALDAAYWSRALELTNVFDLMPQDRRSEWQSVIRECKAPAFDEVAVLSTLSDMIASKYKYFAERVDAVFGSLSKTHLTNQPEGFAARLILSSVVNDDYVSSEKGGYIHDLRCVIARLMGRSEPSWVMNSGLFKALSRKYGEFLPIDGGVIRMKLFKNGNVHIEIGPDMAWKLNTVLSSLYPLAIPSRFRTKPKKVPKEFALIGKPLGFDVIRTICDMRPQSAFRDEPFTENQNSFVLNNGSTIPEPLRKETVKVIEFLGGAEFRINGFRWYEFDYNPQDVIDYIATTGCIPDKVSHQFYPTKSKLAELAVAEADIKPTDTVLEPEAGHGGIAQFLPMQQTTCVEISPLLCKVLSVKGFNVVNDDFLKWALTAPMFDKVVSNPPYSLGRAVMHIKASALLVKNGGRLVGILPGSLRGKDLLGEGWRVSWSPVFSDEFDGTGVVVAIMTAQKNRRKDHA